MKITVWLKINVWLDKTFLKFCKAKPYKWLRKAFRWCFCGSYHNFLACYFIKNETLAQVFSCEFYETSKNTFLHRTPLMAASYFLIFSQKSSRLSVDLSEKNKAESKIIRMLPDKQNFSLFAQKYSRYSSPWKTNNRSRHYTNETNQNHWYFD